MDKLEQRMYGLVPYNISPIQQGIQFGHAVVEYGLKHGRTHVINDKVCTYTRWARNDKTFIILNGGTTNNNEERFGTLNSAVALLSSLDVKLATFHEPDLGDQLTAVVFLVDERVWNKEKYPDYTDRLDKKYLISGTQWSDDDLIETSPEYYDRIMGKDYQEVLEMREFLSNYRLA